MNDFDIEEILQKSFLHGTNDEDTSARHVLSLCRNEIEQKDVLLAREKIRNEILTLTTSGLKNKLIQVNEYLENSNNFINHELPVMVHNFISQEFPELVSNDGSNSSLDGHIPRIDEHVDVRSGNSQEEEQTAKNNGDVQNDGDVHNSNTSFSDSDVDDDDVGDDDYDGDGDESFALNEDDSGSDDEDFTAESDVVHERKEKLNYATPSTSGTDDNNDEARFNDGLWI